VTLSADGSLVSLRSDTLGDLDLMVVMRALEGRRAAGFDHMRVPLDVGPLMQGDERQRREIVDALVATVAAIQRTAYVLRDDPFGLYVRRGDRYPDPQLLRALRLDAPPAADR